MIKVLYKLVGMLTGLVAGALAGAIFKGVWKIAAHEDEAPKATDARRGWREVLIAAALQGAIFAMIRAVADRGTAEGTRKLTGVWPGEDGREVEPARITAHPPPYEQISEQVIRPGGDSSTQQSNGRNEQQHGGDLVKAEELARKDE